MPKVLANTTGKQVLKIDSDVQFNKVSSNFLNAGVITGYTLTPTSLVNVSGTAIINSSLLQNGQQRLMVLSIDTTCTSAGMTSSLSINLPSTNYLPVTPIVDSKVNCNVSGYTDSTHIPISDGFGYGSAGNLVISFTAPVSVSLVHLSVQVYY